MISAIKNLFHVEDIRRRIFWTFGLLFVYRIGYHIPLPGVDLNAFERLASRSADQKMGDIVGLMNALSAGNLKVPVIFALGILPYISSSIIFSLLSKVLPSLEALAKEGAAGQRKLNQYSRLLTVPLCIAQAIGICMTTFRPAPNDPSPIVHDWHMGFVVTAVGGITAGTMFLMWIGEQITEYGVGNGSSLLIVTGIVADIPLAFFRMLQNAVDDRIQILHAILLAAIYLAIVIGVVYISRGQRRIPMHQQKVMKGNRMMGGMKHYLPIRVNMPNVMPVIFASSLLVIPIQIVSWISGAQSRINWLSYGSWLHVVLFVTLIIFFSYFWTSLMFQPTEIAENLKESGQFIPGIRPGKQTATFLERVLVKITLLGGFFLSIIAVIPEIASQLMGVDQLVAHFLGGTGILIVVGVTLDIVDKLNASLLQREYQGFMGAGRNSGGTGSR